MKPVSREEAIECVKKIIRYIGDDPEREGIAESPERIINSYEEIFRGYKQDPREILKKQFKSDARDLIVVSDIEIYSTCEHHMLPFVGKCHIGYLPNKTVIGVSKLARLMDVYARRLQIQEELTFQIADNLMKEIKSFGVAVVIEAQHLCMASRGVNKQHSVMKTTAMLGKFKDNPDLKNEFFRLLKTQTQGWRL